MSFFFSTLSIRRAGIFALACSLFWALSSAAFAQSQAPSTYSAYSGTDSKPAPAAPALGSANSIIADPTFGSRILRVTDPNTNGGESFVPSDSGFHRSWNADSTAIKLTGPRGDGYWMEFNAGSFKVGDGSSHPVPHPVSFGATWEWSAVDPNIIYYLNGNQIAKYNKATGASTNLGGPSTGDPVTYAAVVIGRDNWVCGAAGAGQQDTYSKFFCVNPTSPGTSKFVDIANKTVNGVAQGDPNWPIPAAGQVVGIHDISGGTGANWLELTLHQGSWGGNGGAVFNLATNTWSLITNADIYWGGHVSMGNGTYANASGSQDGRDSRGILLRNPDNLMNTSQYRFVGEPAVTNNAWCDADHISWLNSVTNPNAPILISRYMATANCGGAELTGEIYAAAVDGSGTIWRFAHNHDGGCYYGEGFAQISSDGNWALFSSYWDASLGSDTSFGCQTRIDTFIVELKPGAGGPTTAPSTPPTTTPTTTPTITPTTTPVTPAPTTSPTGSSPTTTPASGTTPVSTSGVTRYEENSNTITYTGSWNPNSSAAESGGSAVLAMDPGSSATFSFNGTGANWIGFGDEWAGIANLYVDGVAKGQIDTYKSPGQYQVKEYSVNGLAAGAHTLKVEVASAKNAASGGNWVWVDAFEAISGGTGATTSTTPTPSVATSSGSGTTSSPTSTPMSSPSVSPSNTVSATSSPVPASSPAPTSTSSSISSGSPVSTTTSVAGGSSAITSGGQTMQIGYAEIAGTPNAPTGMAIFGYRAGGVLVSEAGVPASGFIQHGRVNAEVAGVVNTGFAVANPNGSPANIAFYFTDASGNQTSAGSTTIPPGGQMAKFLSEAPYNASQPTTGTFTFDADVPVAAIALRGYTNERSEFLVTTLPIADTTSATSATLLFPHFAWGGGWSTEFDLVNSSDATISGTLSFFEQGTAGSLTPAMSLSINGQVVSSVSYSIAGRSSVKFVTTGQDSTIHVGSARVTPAQGSSAPAGNAVFSFTQNGVRVSEAGVPLQRQGTAFRMYVESSAAIQSGIAVLNTGGSDEQVTFDLTGLDGSPTGLQGTVTVPAGGQRALFINQIPGLASLPQSFKGIVRVTTGDNAPIVVFGLRGRWNERNEFLVTTTTPANEADSAKNAIIFPHVVDGGGYTTQFIQYSGTPAQPGSGNLQIFSQTGSPMSLSLQ